MDIGAAFRKIIKVDEASDIPEPEYEKLPHPYHTLQKVQSARARRRRSIYTAKPGI